VVRDPVDAGPLVRRQVAAGETVKVVAIQGLLLTVRRA
jgi:membrane protein implicated in regulation of membrane protease activity